MYYFIFIILGNISYLSVFNFYSSLRNMSKPHAKEYLKGRTSYQIPLYDKLLIVHK